MRRILVAVVLVVALSGPVAARPWYFPPHAGKPYVNPHLTHVRLLKGEARAEWDGQLVLWTGVVRRMTALPPRGRTPVTEMILDTGLAEVPVRFVGRVLTLDCDRTGYRVAVKGQVRLEQGSGTGEQGVPSAGYRFAGLDGRSVIVLEPPTGLAMRVPAGQDAAVAFVSWWIGFQNPGYAQGLRDSIADSIVTESRKQGIDPLLLASLIQIESAFHVDAVSRSGAIGLGQLMPFTARGLGVDPRDPRQNVKGAARMIAGLVRAWGGNGDAYALSLASYNAGPSLVPSIGRVPDIPETTNYVYFIGFVHERMTAAATRAGIVAR